MPPFDSPIDSPIVAAIEDPETRWVSFDVFDTLLVRPVLEPADIFAWIEARYPNMLGARSFLVERRVAERRAAALLPATRAEPTLEEIYAQLALQHGLSASEVVELQNVELDTERRLLRPRFAVRPLWELAQRHGKRVLVLSDTYLSRTFVEGALGAAGYAGWSACLVSSEVGATKASGGLYQRALAQLACPPRELVHIGDKLRVDCEVPRQAGIRAFHVPGAAANFFGASRLAGLFIPNHGELPLAARLVLGLTITGGFDRCGPASEGLFGGDLELFGYAGVGPLRLLPHSDPMLRHPFSAALVTLVNSNPEEATAVGLEAVRTGARRFAAELAMTFGDDLSPLEVPPEWAARVFHEFLFAPGQRDAELLRNVKLGQGPVIGDSRATSLWPEGYSALTSAASDLAPRRWLRRSEIRLMSHWLGPTARLRLFHSPERAFEESGRRWVRLYGACRKWLGALLVALHRTPASRRLT